jgi:16S rRNA processing protein RimM
MVEIAAAPADRKDYLVVAMIRKPHGIRGEMALALETDRPGAVFRNGRRLELGDARGRPIGSSITVERARPITGGLLLKAVGFDGRTPELEALRGRSLLIESGEAAPAAPDELHYQELVTMTVVIGEKPVGTIREVTETAAGEMLIVERTGGGELLLPFVREWIRTVDRAERKLVMDPPEGLMEL